MASDEQQENTATGLPFTRGKRKGRSNFISFRLILGGRLILS